MNLFIGYPKCSTCIKAKKYLDNKHVDYLFRDIKTQNPSAEELKLWHQLSGVDIKKFFNTSGLKYKELNLKETLANLSLDEKYHLLASDGMLVKRPLIIMDKQVIIGFKEKEYEEVF